MSLPKAFPTTTAAGTFSRNTLAPGGRMAVTPVLIESPRAIVVWPTRTPATSVMASSGPGGSTPTTMPRSRARGRGVWESSGPAVRPSNSSARSCISIAPKLASEPLLRPLTTEVRVTDVSAARAALDRGRPVVLVIPPAVEQADAVWELVPPAIPALVVCLDHTTAAEWAARAPVSLRVHAVTSLGRAVPLLKETPVDVVAGAPQDLAALAAKSVLKLDAIRTVVLAWPEGFPGTEPAGALDTLLAETRNALRLVLSWNPAALRDFLERHAHRAEVVGTLPVDANGKPLGPLGPARYLVTPVGRRAAAVREAVDALRATRPVVRHGGD